MASTIDSTLAQVVLDVASIFRPPERLTVSEAAEKYVYLNNAPSYIGPYKNDETPYMIEPMNLAMSRDYTSLVFVGPAQSGKTQAIILNVIAYVIMCNPMDVVLYHMTQSAARDFSKRRIDRMHRHSKLIGAELQSGQHADNTHDKTYKSGMMLSVSWPSISEMSSKPVPIVMFTDYDRMPDDIQGEGSPFVLGQKRTTTFRNLGMTIVDSSPGREVEQEKDEDRKRIKGDHEAPPCTGILGLYNQGDRHRLYWPCPECGDYFEPSFSLLVWKTKDEEGRDLSMSEIGDTVRMRCPHCDAKIEHHMKEVMNKRRKWLREGEKIDRDGNVTGNPRRSKMASFWQKGPSATYITWRDMVVKYLEAELHYERTGSQEELKATVNTDQAEPYVPRGTGQERLAEDLEARADKNLPERAVPKGVRCLFATCDTQKNRWEVQVHGVKPGAPYDLVVIDRFKIEKSNRLDADDDPLWVKPASYPEDWDLLIEKVMDKTYPLETGDGHMAIAMTFCDSGGGKERSHDKKASGVDEDMSVTSNAYNFWRRLRKMGRADRFMLLKGDPNLLSPRAHVEYPDSKRNDRKAGAMGEIPVLFLNVNSLKDTLNSMLERTEPGGGMIEFPAWLPSRWFEELTAESRGKRGWFKIGSRRNESWDLLTYCLGACLFRRIEKVDWTAPPPWLSEWDSNPFVTKNAAEKAPVDKNVKSSNLLAELGAELA
jgi:phage terminase large subunit GpA-like protein